MGQNDTLDDRKRSEPLLDMSRTLEDSETSWPMLSSIVNMLTSDRNHQSINTAIENTDLNMSSIDNEATILSSHHIDPVNFLISQQENLLGTVLPSLAKLYQKYSETGDKHLNSARKKVLDLIREVAQSYDALIEIYQSEKRSFEEKYHLFHDWMEKRNEIQRKISQIEVDSPEGKTYTSLLSVSEEVNNEIHTLEERLSLLRKKKKLINHQLLETKSLMDVKLNHHYNDLEILEGQEADEINHLFKEKVINSKSLSDTQVTKKIKLQVGMFDSLVANVSDSKLRIEQANIYLSDIFHSLHNMEVSIKTLLQEGKIDQVSRQLLNTHAFLVERLNLLKHLKLTHIEAIVKNEVTAIERALAMLDIPVPDRNITVTATTPNDKQEQLEDSNNNSPNLSGDSTEYHYVSSLDNISILNANKPTIQFNKTSISRPGAAKTTTNATTTITATPTTSSKSTHKNKSRSLKYDLILTEMKNAKGGKTD